MLCHAMLCYAVLCYAMLCCEVGCIDVRRENGKRREVNDFLWSKFKAEDSIA